MSDIAIRSENISKLYHIGRKQEKYKTLRDTLADAFMSPVRRMGRLLRGQATGAAELNQTFWALRNVSIEVRRGEVVGVIGRNGAGKSTLLKILSGITEPTDGYADIHGRVGSLLEVGTGFHQELTGRENVYLNGAILGMKRGEVERKFDEIVSFAEVEKFIDTPVKHYSTGMNLRLAFAVAAHLEPEILIIDEVLAVGDAAFQKKCIAKMHDVVKEGRTVLFVSHNMLAVQSLCNRALLLEAGRITFEGPVEQTVTRYLAAVDQLRLENLELREDRNGGELFRFVNVQFLHADSMSPSEILISGQPVIIRIGYRGISDTILKDVGIGISFYTATGSHLFSSGNKAVGVKLDVNSGKGHIDCVFAKWPLKGGCYSYDLFAGRKNITLDLVKDAGTIDVKDGDYYGFGKLPGTRDQGVLVDYTYKLASTVKKFTTLS